MKIFVTLCLGFLAIGVSSYKNDTVIDGYKYQLRNVLPYPVHGEEQTGKTAKILVSKNNSSDEEYFNAIVVGKGMDCGNSFMIQFDDDIANPPSPCKVYYEINLPEKYKVSNERISVKVRAPNNKAIACAQGKIVMSDK